MEVPKPQSFSPSPAAAFSAAAPSSQPQSVSQGTVKMAAPVIGTRKKGPQTSILIIIGFALSVIVLGLGYVVFIKPDTGPAAALFGKLFPARSGLVQLQTIELDFDTVINSPVFQKLQHKGAPIEIPPLGKPNPFL